MFKSLEELVNIIRERKNSGTSKSYTHKLLSNQKMCISKVNEEISELIEAIEFEVPEKSAYAKFPNPASRYAIVGVYVAKLKKEVRVAVTGAESCVFRCKKIEDALSSNFSPSAIDNVSISSKGFNADIHASAEYRAHIIKVMAKKAVSSC